MTPFFLLLFSLFQIHESSICSDSVCEYYWEITEWITGMFGAHSPVWSSNSTYYFLNNSDNLIYPVPDANISHVIGLDGYQRIIPLINGSMPGPAIEVYEGAEVVVHVTNRMANEATAIHWHGLYQHGTPWMDGVSSVTQCAILPGDTFTYRFIADPVGTHWYHSHHGLQRPDGLFGAFIIHQNKSDNNNLHEKLCGDRQSTLMINEWFHVHNEDILLQRIGPGFRVNGPKKPQAPWTFNIAHKIASETPFRSILFNGKGRVNLSESELMETPFENILINPSSGGTHCFRLIHSGMERALEISIDEHTFTIISSDGFDIEPTYALDSLIIGPGESYDIYINTTNILIDNYWIRARTLEVEQVNEGYAILQYLGAPNKTLPITSPNQCNKEDNNNLGCFVANCPFPIMPLDSNKTCLHLTNFTNYDSSDNVINYSSSQTLEYFLNFEFGPLGVNRRAYSQTGSPILTQYDDAINSESYRACNSTLCDYHGCNCTHILDLPFNYSIQMIFTNTGRYAAAMHPVHLHGHSFQILNIGESSDYNKTTGVIYSNFTKYIHCINGTDCAKQEWIDYNQNIKPYLKLNRPIRKNTVIVQPGGYVIVRWITNNPGVWHLHCHMTQHLYWGLGMVITEASEFSSLFPPPPDFPTCGDFDYTDKFMWQSVNAYDQLWQDE